MSPALAPPSGDEWSSPQDSTDENMDSVDTKELTSQSTSSRKSKKSKKKKKSTTTQDCLLGALAMTKDSSVAMDRSVGVGSVDPTINSSLSSCSYSLSPSHSSGVSFPVSSVTIRALLSENRRLQRLLGEERTSANNGAASPSGRVTPGNSTGRVTPGNSTITSSSYSTASYQLPPRLSPLPDGKADTPSNADSQRGRKQKDPGDESHRRSSRRSDKSRSKSRGSSRRRSRRSSSKRRSQSRERERRSSYDYEEEAEREKLWNLRSKLKQEALHAMQMEKTAETNAMEIQCLRQELHTTLEALNSIQQEQAQEKARQEKETKKLQTDLLKSQAELQTTLKMLQERSEQVVQLERDLRKAKKKAKSPANVLCDMDACRQLHQQNMMLKLVVEDLREALKRRSDSDIEMDSRAPPVGTIPRSIRLDAVSHTDTSELGY